MKHVIQNTPEQAISYSAYMDLALYHPTYGYYMKEKEKIGRSGDFFTSSNVSSVFAKQFARFFIQLIEGGAVPPAICEIGAGTGRFAHDVLAEWREQSPETFSQLAYSIVETSSYHQKLQQDLLSDYKNVTQYTSIDEIGPSFEGIIFSNELFDAFPVEVIEKRNGRIYEVYITFDERERLSEEFRMLKNEQIVRYLQQHRIRLREGQRFEVPLLMGEYIKKLGNWLHKGLCITVDYGYTNEEWGHPLRHEGSLRGYCEHQLVRDPLAYPGDMDLTAHVHWDELKRVGKENSLYTIWHTKQTKFLLAAGILEQLVDHTDRNPFSEQNKKNRAIRSMIINGGISDSFDVVIQQKGMPSFRVEKYLQQSSSLT
ncbi:MAG: class I SAM-dependent methyltransferase [Ectobacillus sp.]